MAGSKVITYTQVSIIQENIRAIHLVALNPTATIFQLTAEYEIKDSLGGSRGMGTFSQQVATAPDPTLIASILAAANAAQGT